MTNLISHGQEQLKAGAPSTERWRVGEKENHPGECLDPSETFPSQKKWWGMGG